MRGLGQRILEECEIAALREGFRELDLVATLPGIPLYRAFGFSPTAEVEDVALADGVLLPCLAMSKEIDSGAARERAATASRSEGPG